MIQDKAGYDKMWVKDRTEGAVKLMAVILMRHRTKTIGIKGKD